MVVEKLQKLGFSKNEATIYGALLDLDESSPGAIAAHTKIHQRNVYDALKRLIDKGLVFRIISKSENIYSPVDPDKLLEMVREKDRELRKILPGLKARYQERKVGQEAYIYRGIEGFKNYLRDILRVGEDVYFIGGKLIWVAPELKGFSEQFLKEVKRKKIRFHCIFDAEVKERGKDALKHYSPPHKFLPQAYSTNSVLVIFGDYVVAYTGVTFMKLENNLTVFVLKDKNLAESYRTWFTFMSDHLP